MYMNFARAARPYFTRESWSFVGIVLGIAICWVLIGRATQHVVFVVPVLDIAMYFALSLCAGLLAFGIGIIIRFVLIDLLYWVYGAGYIGATTIAFWLSSATPQWDVSTHNSIVFLFFGFTIVGLVFATMWPRVERREEVNR